MSQVGQQRPKFRLSIPRLLLVAAIVGVIGWFFLHRLADVQQRARIVDASAATTTFAGYVDVTATPPYPFESLSQPNQQDVILAFIVAGKDDPCQPTWGTYYSLDEAATGLDLDRRITQLRLSGGDVRISFGGQANSELALACTDPAALAAAYQAVVDRYQVGTIDLDIEGAGLSDTAATARRVTAIKALQDAAKAKDGSLAVWLTLPVSPTGLTAEGVAQVDAMLAGGVELAGVNGMAMDFGGAKSAGTPMIDAVIDSAKGLHGQVVSAWQKAGRTGASWSQVGVTPMIGQNDVPAEQFTIEDAGKLNEFARANDVGLLSMWSMNRDSTCKPPLPIKSVIVRDSCSGVDQGDQSFAAVLAGNTRPASPTTAASAVASQAASATPVPSDDPETSPYPIWEPDSSYPKGSKVVYEGLVYQAKWYTSGFAPDTAVGSQYETPWRLLGPVMPGDKPAPLPTLPKGTYPQWDAQQAYFKGARVQVGLVPYEAKYWSQGVKPGTVDAAGQRPWAVVQPGGN